MNAAFVLLSLTAFFSFAQGISSTAPGWPGIASSWPSAKKQGFGTAYQTPSKVWFTITNGVLSEVFFPRIDRVQTRKTQLLISDGKTFLHSEENDTIHTVVREGDSPFYRISNRDRLGRYEIIKEVWSDPDSNTVVQKIRLVKNVEGLKFYLFHLPAGANSIFGDDAVAEPLLTGQSSGFGAAWHGIAANVEYEKKSVGYLGTSDLKTDLNDFQVDEIFSEALNGNVTLGAQLKIPEEMGVTEFSLFMIFDDTRAEVETALPLIGKLDLAESKKKYVSGWNSYIQKLKLPMVGRDPDRRSLLVQSALVLKCGEDKTYPGSIIASPSHPWGEKQIEPGPYPGDNPGYHLVWPRDLYHITNALIAIEDKDTAIAALDRLMTLQFGEKSGEWYYPPRVHSKKGSFPQNAWVDGTPAYDGYQADETAMPVLLGYTLWKKGWISLSRIWPQVESAARFLAEVGVWTQQERWEETYGVSPNTAAYVIAAMKAASEMARAVGSETYAREWLDLAEKWGGENGIDAWTFTTKGKIQGASGDGRYYLRLSANVFDSVEWKPLFDAPWDPNSPGIVMLANVAEGDPFRFQSEIIDGGFLALVELGLRPAQYSLITDTLPEIDQLLKVETPTGPGWYRYRYDRYGENAKGRLWPLLTGERLRYEIQRLKEAGETDIGSKMEEGLSGYEGFSNEQGLFSEQVWDEGGEVGTPTGSATPLLWTHAEYLQLSKAIADETRSP